MAVGDLFLGDRLYYTIVVMEPLALGFNVRCVMAAGSTANLQHLKLFVILYGLLIWMIVLFLLPATMVHDDRG